MVWVFLGIGVLFFLLVLFVRSERGQDIIVTKATQYLSKKTETVVSIDKLFITFSGKIDLQGLYVEDQKKDTLVYSKELQAAIPIIPILRGRPIAFHRVSWDGLRAHIYRRDSIEGFNYQFLIDAFDSDEGGGTVKDTAEPSGESPKISVGKVDLTDFKIRYTDSIGGIYAKLNLGKLHFRGDRMDLDKMIFEARELELENTLADLEITKPFPADEEESTAPLPLLSVQDVQLKNVRAHYAMLPDSMAVDADIPDFQATDSRIDLPENQLDFEKIHLDQTYAAIKLWGKGAAPPEPPKNVEGTEFPWPDWNINAGDVVLNDIHFIYQGTQEPPKQTHSFNPDYIELKNFNLNLQDTHLGKEEQLKTQLRELAFTESSGLAVKRLNFNLDLDSTQVTLSDLNVETNKSILEGEVEARYASLEGLIDQPDKTQLNIDIPRLRVDLNEVYTYLPDLKNNPYLKNSTRYKLDSRLKAEGSLAALKVSEGRVNWGPHTRVQLRGNLKNITDVNRLSYDVGRLQIQTLRSDILQFIEDQDYGIRLPDTLQLNGTVRGTLKDYHVQSQLTSSNGSIDLTANYNDGSETYDANLVVRQLNLGELLGQPDMGEVGLQSEIKGSGKSVENLNADAIIDIPVLEFKEYRFSDVKATAHIVDGEGNVELGYTDDNLDFSTLSQVKLDSLSQWVSTQIDVRKADLQKLNFYNKNVVSKLKMTADFEHNDGDMEIQARIDEGIANYEEWDHQLGEVDFKGSLKNKETRFSIESNFLNGEMEANANVHILELALKRQLKRYFRDTIYALDSIRNPVELEMHLRLNENDLVNNVFLPEIRKMDTLKVDIDFKQADELLVSQITLPELQYGDYKLEGLFFNINSGADVAQYILGYENLDAGIFGMYRTFINGDLQEGKLTTNFFAFNEEDEVFYSGHSETTGKEGNIHFHLLPYNLMLNGEDWTIPEDNELVLYKDSIQASDLVLSRAGQKLEIANNLSEIKRPQIGLRLENFELQNLLGLLNPEEGLASGIVQGRLIAVNPRGKLGLLGDLEIGDLHVLEAPLGDLSFRAFSRDTDTYRFKMGLKGEDTDLEAQGRYAAEEGEDSAVKIELDLNRLGFKTIANLSQNELKDASGALTGHFTVEGKTSDLQYDGRLQFEDASFLVTQTNSRFTISDEELLINSRGITINQFAVQDEKGHEFVVDGSILSRKWKDPEFDLKMRANDFQLANSTEEDNDLFYGKLNFDLNGYVQGRMSLPTIFVNIDVNKDTDFTYVYSAAQAGIEKRDGIVEFVNKEHPKQALVKKDSTFLERMKGMQLHAKLNVDKRARLSVTLDPRTGDNIAVSGEAALDYRVNPNGISSLTGRYVIDKGHYKMNLYNLVGREFQFRQGSKIVWNGDPMDADIDVSAIYETKASAAGLMASETGGIGVGEDNQYKRRLPFLVYLNVGGSIDQPELSFALDMPEESRGELGGAVYNKVNQLNDDQGELNRQVFSLLVLKQFFPQSGADGSSGGFTEVARDNLNDALADQLSAFSDELLGSTGVRLNFGIDSYTDYSGQSSQQRTDVNITAEKSLLNDRLIVKAGTDVNVQGDRRPGEESALLGNVSIEYLLTEDGRWRLKGFRKDEYDNVIDGQVFINGIGLIFQRDFTRFSYLWRSFIGNPEKYYTRKREERESAKKQEEQEKAEVQQEEEETQKDN